MFYDLALHNGLYFKFDVLLFLVIQNIRIQCKVRYIDIKNTYIHIDEYKLECDNDIITCDANTLS